MKSVLLIGISLFLIPQCGSQLQSMPDYQSLRYAPWEGTRFVEIHGTLAGTFAGMAYESPIDIEIAFEETGYFRNKKLWWKVRAKEIKIDREVHPIVQSWIKRLSTFSINISMSPSGRNIRFAGLNDSSLEFLIPIISSLYPPLPQKTSTQGKPWSGKTNLQKVKNMTSVTTSWKSTINSYDDIRKIDIKENRYIRINKKHPNKAMSTISTKSIYTFDLTLGSLIKGEIDINIKPSELRYTLNHFPIVIHIQGQATIEWNIKKDGNEI